MFRNWRSRDVEALCRHANNKNIWLNLLDRFPHPYTRRDAERWIAAGRVKVDGKVLDTPAFTVTGASRIEVDGNEWAAGERWDWLPSDLGGYDLVLSSSHAFAKGVLTGPLVVVGFAISLALSAI